MLRLAQTAVAQGWQCNEDTAALGHHIPKGTAVLFADRGPSFTKPGFDIRESFRSSSCQTAARGRGIRAWEMDRMDRFCPEKWLVKGDLGNQAFDALAGSTIPFRLGLRGCFGSKLAYLELKLWTAMMV